MEWAGFWRKIMVAGFASSLYTHIVTGGLID